MGPSHYYTYLCAFSGSALQIIYKTIYDVNVWAHGSIIYKFTLIAVGPIYLSKYTFTILSCGPISTIIYISTILAVGPIKALYTLIAVGPISLYTYISTVLTDGPRDHYISRWAYWAIIYICHSAHSNSYIYTYDTVLADGPIKTLYISCAGSGLAHPASYTLFSCGPIELLYIYVALLAVRPIPQYIYLSRMLMCRPNHIIQCIK